MLKEVVSETAVSISFCKYFTLQVFQLRVIHFKNCSFLDLIILVNLR